MCRIRQIREADDFRLAEIIRKNLEKFNLAVPGTIYFDPCLDHLSKFYTEKPEERRYFVLEDGEGKVLGGIGLDRFHGFDQCVEIQKLYVSENAKGNGYGKCLLETAEKEAVSMGYRRFYLETHSNLKVAIHMYENMGYHRIERPQNVQHSTMDLFFLKEV